ncbi:hypothetical protein ACIRQY_35520 [Streptomyces sp. NPDC101490]|uniref:hypothetical protein n=1 Tax=Streptomyces sp. NPDC101490 TaxID=3366143 RepID=UPI0038275B71
MTSGQRTPRRSAAPTARTTGRRAAVVGLTLAACLGAAPLTATATATAAPASGLDRYYQQRPDWRGCSLGPEDRPGRDLDAAGAQCADMTVPLDYADPRGRILTLAISRLKATDTALAVSLRAYLSETGCSLSGLTGKETTQSITRAVVQWVGASGWRCRTPEERRLHRLLVFSRKYGT